MGRHWALRRSGRVVPPTRCPLSELEIKIDGLGQFVAEWNWAGSPDGEFFYIELQQLGGDWVTVVGPAWYEASEVPWESGVYSEAIGDSYRIRATVAGYDPVVSAPLLDE